MLYTAQEALDGDDSCEMIAKSDCNRGGRLGWFVHWDFIGLLFAPDVDTHKQIRNGKMMIGCRYFVIHFQPLVIPWKKNIRDPNSILFLFLTDDRIF